MKKMKLFLVLPLFALILGGCGQQNLTNPQNTNQNSNASSTTNNLTMTELALHNTPGDCWILIKGQVYDVTAYIASGQHGGGDKILQGCGIDATALFSAVGKHNGKGQAMLPQYLLGTIK